MKPILFNTEKVRAILDGRKTQTRRIIKPQPKEHNHLDIPADWRFEKPAYYNQDSNYWACKYCGEGTLLDGTTKYKCPYQPGDILWVRETWCKYDFGYVYKADDEDLDGWGKWHPSIHMPREAARIFLRVTNVRVERLQEISHKDAAKEGINDFCVDEPRYKFASLWNSTIKKSDFDKYGWNANPWVWVIEFERVSEVG